MSNGQKQGGKVRMAPVGHQPSKRDVETMSVDMGELEIDEDSIENVAENTVEVVNVSHMAVKLQLGRTVHIMQPGKILDVPAAYGTPRIYNQGGDPNPSVVEMETNRKVLPVLDPRVAKDDDGVPLCSKRSTAKASQPSA